MNLWNTLTNVPKAAGSSNELAVGNTVLGQRYRLEKLLGVGATGPVWLAEDLELATPRALKFLSDLAADELEDLKAETLRCQELTHQNIVRIYDFVRDEHHAAICMEVIDGPNLRSALKDRQPPCFHPDELRFWLEELCRALHHAHTFAKIIHRDLKPANLLVTLQGHLKVADFGIAQGLPKRMVRDESSTRIAGTLEYVSPQQVAGDPPAVSDDIYGFGATLTELLTGRPPFVGEEVYEQVLHQPAPSVNKLRGEIDEDLPPIPETWENVVARCLSKDAGERPESIREIAEALGLELRQLTIREPLLPEGILDAAPQEASLTGPLSMTRRVRTLRDLPMTRPGWQRRWPWLAGAGGLTLLLGVTFCRPDKPTLDTPSPITQAPRTDVDSTTSVTATKQAFPTPQESAAKESAQRSPELDRLENALQQGDWSTAREALQALEKAGQADLPRVMLAKARLQALVDESGEAMATLRKLLEQSPNNAEATLLKAKLHAKLSEWQAVRHAASWAIAQPDNHAQVGKLLGLRGQANRTLGHLNKAINDYGQAIREEDRDAEAFYQRGLALREEGRLQKAIHDLTSAIRLEPDRTAARAARARLLLQDGQLSAETDTIIEDLSYVIDANPKDIDARLDRLRCYYHAQQWQNALGDAAVLLEYQPQWQEARKLRATAALKSGKTENVPVEDLKLFAQEFPDDLENWFRLAERQLRNGKYDEAKESFNAILRRDPRASEAREGRAFAFYSIAKSLAAANKQPELRHHYRYLGILDINKFITETPNLATADTYLLKTRLYFYRGDYYPEADMTARQGRKLFPKSKGEFDWWIEEIKVASSLEKAKDKAKAKRRRGRPDKPNWFERFFKRKS